ncbi:MAG: ribonuclease HII, partial [Mangrovibacterium sp.]
PYPDIPPSRIETGDGPLLPTAAASVLATSYRDELMTRLHLRYPYYGWNKNKGYPTSAHRKALMEKGPSPFHRMSFRLQENQLKLDL